MQALSIQFLTKAMLQLLSCKQYIKQSHEIFCAKQCIHNVQQSKWILMLYNKRIV